jgi:hypothetical protein
MCNMGPETEPFTHQRKVQNMITPNVLDLNIWKDIALCLDLTLSFYYVYQILTVVNKLTIMSDVNSHIFYTILC